MVTLPLPILIILGLVCVLIGLLVASFLFYESPKKTIKRALDLDTGGMIAASKQYEQQAIERGYGEMYDKPIEGHPSVTVPTFRWIEPNS